MLFNSKILGFLTCMFWGLSDKYSESVLEIYCRGRTTCLLFYLLTLIFFIKYLKSPSDKKYYYISILTSTLAYVSNWNSIMLLPLLAITLSFFKQEKIFHTLRTNFLSFIPFVVIFLLYSICQLLFKSSHPPSDYYNLDFSFLD